jgi:hypothetical protein
VKGQRNAPLIFFGQTSKSAAVRAPASSVVNHEPSPTSHKTDIVSRTMDKVSSEVSSKNGPRSLVMRGMMADWASEMYRAKLHLSGQRDSLL